MSDSPSYEYSRSASVSFSSWAERLKPPGTVSFVPTDGTTPPPQYPTKFKKPPPVVVMVPEELPKRNWKKIAGFSVLAAIFLLVIGGVVGAGIRTKWFGAGRLLGG